MSKVNGVLFLLLAICLMANAQSIGTIGGRITDSSGAAIPGATVTATNTATSVSRETITNELGIYSLLSLQPGTYNVKVELAGFAPQESKALNVLTGAALKADFVLTVAAVTENVTVNTVAPLVNTTESGTTGELRLQEVQNLPMINRNFQGLIQILPGARPAPIVNSTRTAFGNGI